MIFALAAAYDFAALRAADLRLATIAQRLVTANAPICAERVAAPGIVVHALDQYAPEARDAARAAFGFATPVAVEAVVPGSAAERAGARADDGLVAMGGAEQDVPRPIPARSPGLRRGGEYFEVRVATREAALAAIERAMPEAPLRLTIRRGDATFDIAVPLSPACRSRFEIADEAETAFSDGKTVQIGLGYLARWRDDQVAVILAHELAHNILRHRARQAAARVDTGAGAEFGRNLRINRRVEAEADRLGVHLLRNAGYDPQIAVRFWAEEGPKVAGGVFRSRIYARPAERARAVAAEIAEIPPNAPTPYAPPLLATQSEALR